jgi:biopolymer transport protein ExbB
MMDIIEKGGVLMYPIMALSVISLAIFMERMFTLRKEKFAPVAFTKMIKSLLSRKAYIEAESLCKENDSAISRVIHEVIQNRTQPWPQLVEAAEGAGKREADRLERFQEAMSTIVALSPLLGLLGTVFGMITLFSVLSGGGVGDPQALSGGIAVALLTTAAGLSVAIPAQIFHYVIKMRSDSIVNVLEKESMEIAGIISSGYVNEVQKEN